MGANTEEIYKQFEEIMEYTVNFTTLDYSSVWWRLFYYLGKSEWVICVCVCVCVGEGTPMSNLSSLLAKIIPLITNLYQCRKNIFEGVERCTVWHV